MLLVGLNLAFFLKTLPPNFLIERLSKQIWLELSASFLTLVDALATIGAALIVLSLIFLSIILIVGGIVRLVLIQNKKLSSKATRNELSNK